MSWGQAVAGIAQGLSNIFGNKIQAKQSGRNVQDQARYNRELADRQYGHQLDMWNKMNEYNAPVAQMQRYKEAGLNPHLIYGKGGSAGNAQTMPQYQEQAPDFSIRKAFDPTVGAKGITEGILAYQKVKNNDNVIAQQIDNLKVLEQTLEERILNLRSQGYKAKYDAIASEYNSQIRQTQDRIAKATADNKIREAEQNVLLRDKKLTIDNLTYLRKNAELAVFNNTSAKGLTLDQSRLVQGWTDILERRFDTPQAKSIIIDIVNEFGKTALNMFRDLIPTKFISEALGGAIRRANINRNRSNR